MKRLFLAVLITLAMAVPVGAADVTLSITVPDAYVPRLQAAVGSLNCTVVDENGVVVQTLDPKACLIRKMKNELADFINKYEVSVAKQTLEADYNAAYQAWVESYVPVPLQ